MMETNPLLKCVSILDPDQKIAPVALIELAHHRFEIDAVEDRKITNFTNCTILHRFATATGKFDYYLCCLVEKIVNLAQTHANLHLNSQASKHQVFFNVFPEKEGPQLCKKWWDLLNHFYPC